jgi:Plant transposon protein
VRIFNAVQAEDFYFTWRKDAVGKPGASGLQKAVSALRQLAYDTEADSTDVYCKISETTASESLTRFSLCVVPCFGSEFLRAPTQYDLKTVEEKFALSGFPGCFGAVDCASWTWKNCPKALQGIHVGKDGVPVLRMEVVCDLDLWIRGSSFGFPGMMNDLNILELSPLFNIVFSRRYPPFNVSFKIGEQEFESIYFLADGIYPSWRSFAKSYSIPANRRQEYYNTQQEGIRKCVERLFGVLFQQFQFLQRPSRLWGLEEMQKVFKVCVVMHNMLVDRPTENMDVPTPTETPDQFLYKHDFIIQCTLSFVSRPVQSTQNSFDTSMEERPGRI